MAGKTLTVAIMDAPYQSPNSTTALRIINAVLQKGHNVNVFAYEGAANLTMRTQAPYPNPVKGPSVEQEQHPTTKDWVGALFKLANQKGAKLDWVNCGLYVDERGAGDWIEGTGAAGRVQG